MSTANSIDIAEDKVLKLNNLMSRDLDASDNDAIQKIMNMMGSYVKSNELEPYGPMIIRSSISYENMRPVKRDSIMAQLRNMPAHIDNPYRLEGSIRVEHCLMARYRGPEYMLQMAYGKMQVYCFERSIHLSDTTYTVLTDRDEEGNIAADVFAEMI